MKKEWKLINPGKREFEVLCGNESLSRKLFKYIPVKLIPMSSESILYVGIVPRGNGYHMFLSDMRYVEDKGWSSNMEFALMTDKKSVKKFLDELVRLNDNKTNCMGLTFFFRQLNRMGFSIITKRRKQR
jgi:hypothetical protein